MFSRQRWVVALIAAVAMLGGAVAADAALVSQFTFENDTIGGTTVNDDGGLNTNNGTLQDNAAIIDDGSLRGNVLSVDGSGDYSLHPDHTSLDINGTALSLIGWVYKTDTNDGTLVGKELGSGAAWGLEVNSGKVRFFIWGADGGRGDLNNVAGQTNDTWQHVAGTYDGTTMHVYIDGVVKSSTTTFTEAISTNNDPLMLGYSKISGDRHNYLAGKIDDVGVYNSGVGAKDVAVIHGLGKFQGVHQADGAVGNVVTAFNAGAGSLTTVRGVTWVHQSGLTGSMGTTGGTLDDGNAYIVLDGSGNGMQAAPNYVGKVLTQNPLEYYRTDTLIGEMGDVLTQNGVDIDQTTPSPTLDTAGGFRGLANNNSWSNYAGEGGDTLTDVVTGWDSEEGTISYWVRLDGDGNGTQTGLMGKETGATGDFDVAGNIIATFMRTNGSFGFRVGASQVSTANSVLAMDEWHHLAFTWDRGTGSGDGVMRVYLDGEEKTFTTTATWADFTIDHSARFGKELNEGGGNPRRLKGSADEIAIWTQALSATEIQAQYDAALVPEPSTLALAAIGLLGLRRRRR